MNKKKIQQKKINNDARMIWTTMNKNNNKTTNKAMNELMNKELLTPHVIVGDPGMVVVVVTVVCSYSRFFHAQCPTQ